ncbi:cytosine permease [Serratia sp. UGAL515B_01]|uniref:purine-cytosine permease family protein n=1 Tax=Serratia sp. UGAL515B_01 TaxID=2986763 RepID=UPI002952BF90|nr:cytosine permease [Serratia sp. UGAL515B_01]WON78454.1 cytosine permease [Serratia sp. UGAL515B_01]
MTTPKTPPLIEARVIDFIPEDERHGKPFSQFTLWFGANLQITAIVTGALAVVLGGDAFWSIIGLMLGQVIGGAIMALHGMQGPKLGLPQMVTSRAQFGVLGASIPIVLVCTLYMGFNTTGLILAGQAISQLAHVSSTAGILTFAAIVIISAMIGYRLIHRLGRVATVLGILAFTYLFIRLLTINDISLLLENRHFQWDKFLIAVSLSASWQISFSPYASDYSRYLPSKTPSSKVFFAIWSGSVIGSQISMVLGVFAAALAGSQFSGNEVGYIVSLGANGIMAALLYFSIAFGKVTISTLNAYGSLMCLTTIISGFKGNINHNKYQRLAVVIFIVGVSTCLAFLAKDDFLRAFRAFLLFLLTFFTPWAAINIASFYFVSKGHYDNASLLDPDGCYGRWNFFGISIYFLGVLIQIPFISTTLYTGPIYTWLGTDISWIVGLIVPATLYSVFGHQKANVLRSLENSH